MATKIKHRVARRNREYPCRCGEMAERVSPSNDERREYGCAVDLRAIETEDTEGMGCCARAFTCQACGKHYVGRAADRRR